MSAGHENTKHAHGDAVRSKGVLVRIKNFFKLFDTKAGLVILTFFLTSGLGSLATFLVAQFQQSQSARTAALQARAAELGSLHNGIEASILRREIAADGFINAIEVGAEGAEVGQLWQRYEEAVNDELLSALQSHLVITGHTQDGPEAVRFEGKAWVFWYYLTDVIQPRFASMHECLLRVHNAYVAAGEPLPNRLAKARSELAVCKKDSDWDKFAYTFLGGTRNAGKAGETKVAVSVSDWDDFKTCIEDYAYLLDMSARLEARAGQYEPSSLGGPAWDGWEANFLNTLPGELQKSCGSPDRDFE